MVKGILITTNGFVMQTEIDETKTLESLYSLLKCDLVDCVHRVIGKKEYDIWVDDEGMLKDNPIITAISKDKNEVLVGNIFICNANEEGEMVSLTDEDIENLMNENNYSFLGTKAVLRYNFSSFF